MRECIITATDSITAEAGDSIELKVKCPPETECEIELPDGYYFEDNGYNYSAQDITAVRKIKKLCLEEERK